MKLTTITNSAYSTLVAALLITTMVLATFFLLEPSVGRSAASDVFTVRQEITGEISFIVATADVAMTGSILGTTGGNATGTTYAVVRTNSATGYTLNIKVEGDPGMQGESTAGSIRDYGVAGAEPDFTFSASTSAQLAYTVTASTSEWVESSFKDNGSACNSGNGNTANRCWRGLDTADFQIINATGSAPTGATTTLKFKVNVPNTPVPALEADFYTATVTLTATNQ